MPDEEMINKAIQACEDRFKITIINETGKTFEQLGLTLPAKSVWRGYVLIVIEAMREPTEKMLNAENVHKICHTCGGSVEGYQAMIDAILK